MTGTKTEEPALVEVLRGWRLIGQTALEEMSVELSSGRIGILAIEMPMPLP